MKCKWEVGISSHLSRQESYDDVGSKENKDDLFVHKTAIVKSNPRKYPTSVREGGKTELDVVEEEKRKETVNVTGPGGSNVQGSRDSADRSSSRTSGWYLWYRENGNGRRRQYPEDHEKSSLKDTKAIKGVDLTDATMAAHQSTDTMAAHQSTE
uniref:CSD domain-containing protein n=1 Tax=Biomphalaria glabrata TaxID=6526 RepID=A0A2C9K546_BIOGL